MRLPFLRSKPAAAGRERSTAGAEEELSIDAARTRARQRLVGALVLLAVGVIGFPLLFETQPRPLSPDTPIVLSRDGAVASTAASDPEPPPRPAPVTLPPPDAGAEPEAAAGPPNPPRAQNSTTSADRTVP